MIKCRKCGAGFDPTPRQLRISDYICRPCERAYRKTPGKIISEYEFKASVKTFRSQVDGIMMYDIPLASDDYFKNKGGSNE